MSLADLRAAPVAFRMLAIAAIAAVLITLAGRDAAAAGPVTRTWTGAGANSNWTNHANWNPAAPNAGDILVFPAGAARKNNTNDYPAGTSFERVRLTGAGYTLGGNRVNLGEGLLNDAAGGTNTINLVLGGAGGIMNDAGTLQLMADNLHDGTTTVYGGRVHAGHDGAFGQFSAVVDVFAGTVSVGDGVTVYNPLIIGGPGAPALQGLGNAEWDAPVSVAGPSTFDAAPGATLTISGVISGGSLALKTGPGTVVFSGENTYTGNLQISEGVARVTRSEALGSPLGSTTVDGGTLEFDVELMAEPIVVSGTGHEGMGALRNVEGINHLGNVLVDGDATIHVVDGTLRLPNGLEQAGENLEVTQIGGGTLEVEGEGDFDGTINVLDGWLAVRGELLAEVVVDGGVLEGDGAVAAVSLVTGQVAPGIGGTGALTVRDDFEAAFEGWVHFILDSADSHSRLRVEGAVVLDDAQLWVDGDGDVAPGTAVTLIENSGAAPISGEFYLREEGSELLVGGSVFFAITYGGGPAPANDLVFTAKSPESAEASLGIASVPQSVPSGGQVALVFRAANAGPDDATNPRVTIGVGAGLGFVSLVAPAGWACQTPVVGAPGEIVCTRAMLPVGAPQDFAVVFSISGAAGGTVHFSGELSHASADDDPSNDAVDVEVGVSGAGQLPFRQSLPWLARDNS